MSSPFAPFDRALAGRVHRPGTPGFEAACAGFDLSAVPTPDVARCSPGSDRRPHARLNG
jgi:hypothetical protein